MLVEEAIEILKEIIELHEDNCYLSTEDDFKAIKTLIEAYEKQSKEIEELKNEYLSSWVNQKYISKDKIKATIEEYEDYGTSIYYGLRSNGKAFHQAVRMEVKDVLQSLLEEE